MQDPKLEKQINLISSAMKKIEETARSMVRDNDDYMSVCSAMMAVTRNMYLETLTIEETASIFETVAESMFVTQDMIHTFQHAAKPTIH
tara:strand:+ start:306 stop:572 length:267 start_codon:yes stop_codon:yes gene_type:complete